MTKTTRAWMWGAGIGAGAMLLFDPARGRRRRALLRDRLTRAGHGFGSMLGGTSRDLAHRLTGAAVELRTRRAHRPVDDVVLVERVRSKLGRHVAHPSAIAVASTNGHVMLQGPVFAHEVTDLIRAVRHVPGVVDVDNRLEPHDESETVRRLEGGSGRRQHQHTPLRRRDWTPAVRLLAGLGGAGLIVWGRQRRSALRTASVTTGMSLIARSLAPRQAQFRER